MKLLRVAIVSLLAGSLMALPAFAQRSQSPDWQAPKTSQSPSAQQSSQPTQLPSGEFLRNPFTQQNAGQRLAAPQPTPAPWKKIQVPRRKLRRFEQLPDEPPDIDPGIYLRRTAGLGKVCGAIVSYNFSPGENPYLENITTCTPAGIVESRRAEGEQKRPPAPRLIQTNLTGQR